MRITKILFTRTIIFPIVFLFLLPGTGKGQTSGNEAKLQLLQDKVTRAENKVAAAEQKMAIADSLITYGEQRIETAEEEFARIEEEHRQLEKEYFSTSKHLRKLLKSDDPEIVSQAETDLEALESKYKTDSKIYEDSIKQLEKEAARAKKDIAKGNDLQKTASHALKEAFKALEIARENYEAALNNSQ